MEPRPETQLLSLQNINIGGNSRPTLNVDQTSNVFLISPVVNAYTDTRTSYARPLTSTLFLPLVRARRRSLTAPRPTSCLKTRLKENVLKAVIEAVTEHGYTVLLEPYL